MSKKKREPDSYLKHYNDPGREKPSDSVSGAMLNEKNSIAEGTAAEVHCYRIDLKRCRTPDSSKTTAETLRITAEQAEKVCELYSPQEIRSMLRRLEMTSLGQLSQEHAKKIILKRSETFREQL